MLVILGLFVMAAHAAPSAKTSAETLLSRANRFAGNDHDRFLSALHGLEQQKTHLTQRQQEYVEYWRAWEIQQKGDYSRSRRMLTDIIDHADDRLVVTRAKSQLILNYMINRQYVKAFTLANALIKNLNRISDPSLRNYVMVQAIEILNWQKQYDQALKFAKQLKAGATTARDQCKAVYIETDTLLQRGGVLTSSSPQFQKAIDKCLTAGMLSYANTVRLNWASLMDDEGHTQQALALLKRITPDIMKSGFQAHVTSLYVTQAQAYLIEGNYRLAIKWAQATLSSSAPHSFTWTRQAAYKVLYQAQEHAGQYQSALANYKHYVAQYKASMSNARAQALAYQIVKQEVLAKRLKLEELSKKNRILQLRQSLDSKSAETSRLYIALLLVVLASIGFWTWRIKHSQIRFRKMARHDDLTGIFNRPHFFNQAERALKRLQKDGEHACLMILDMDHFKRINDAHGHISGDIVLKHVARICREELRDSDVFGRLGGEEFGILMPGCTIAEGSDIGERVRRALAHAPVRIHDSETITVTSSIGLAGTETHGHALKPLLIAADMALYAAKRGGRNRLVVQPQLSREATA